MDFVQHVGTGLGEDWRGILFRRTFPELKDVIAKANKWFPQIFPTAKYNKAEHVWTFQDGEQLIFGFVEREEDYWKYHGFSFPWIGWEELTNWPTDSLFKRMMSTNRSSNKRVPRKIRATCNPHGCVPYGDVLTTEGWVDIKDVQAGDSVISVSATGDLITKVVSQFHEYGFDGDMISRNGRGLAMTFTPEHRLPVLNKTRDSHSHKMFKELPSQVTIRRAGHTGSWEGLETPERVTPGELFQYNKSPNRAKEVPSLSILDYAELLGWFLSEGSILSRDNAFLISQMKKDNAEEIHKLLKRCGFHYRYDGRDFVISEIAWMKYFSQFGLCRDKFVPRWFLDCDYTTLKTCFDSLMSGDGSYGKVYYSTSKKLSEDVAEMAIKLGYLVTISSRQLENRDGSIYNVNVSKHSGTTLFTGNNVYKKSSRASNYSNCDRTPYKGKVYCLTVPETETFFVRQDGCVWLSSNSGHNWVKARYELPVLPKQSITKIIDNGTEPPRVAIHGTVHQNKILLHADPDYIMKLKASCSSPAEEAAWIDGSWDITSGGMFDDIWDRDIHIIQGITPSMIPKRWLMDRSYDHGQSKPFSVGWWAQSNGEPLTLPSGQIVGQVRGDLIRIQEWYGWDGTPDKGLRMTAAEIAIGIRERQREMGIDGRVRPGVADGSIFDQWEPGKSVQGDMRKKGVKWLRADKGPGTRVQGWQQIRKLLKQAIPIDNHRELPGLFVSDLCTQFLRTFPVLSRDKKDPDDVDTKIEDHIADEVRYRCRAKQAKRTKMIQG